MCVSWRCLVVCIAVPGLLAACGGAVAPTATSVPSATSGGVPTPSPPVATFRILPPPSGSALPTPAGSATPQTLLQPPGSTKPASLLGYIADFTK